MLRLQDMNINKGDFNIDSDEDEIRVDGLWRPLLEGFHRSLLDRGLKADGAGVLAHGADYFVRDFMVSNQRANIFDEKPNLIRRFAATWYILNNLEPKSEQLAGFLEGVREFHRYLRDEGLISGDFMKQVDRECGELAFYEGRIASFWGIRNDGYVAWLQECPLKEEPPSES
jgi:hypothetical protein